MSLGVGERARSLKGGAQERRDSWGFGPGGARSRGGEIPGTPGHRLEFKGKRHIYGNIWK